MTQRNIKLIILKFESCVVKTYAVSTKCRAAVTTRRSLGQGPLGQAAGGDPRGDGGRQRGALAAAVLSPQQRELRTAPRSLHVLLTFDVLLKLFVMNRAGWHLRGGRARAGRRTCS